MFLMFHFKKLVVFIFKKNKNMFSAIARNQPTINLAPTLFLISADLHTAANF